MSCSDFQVSKAPFPLEANRTLGFFLPQLGPCSLEHRAVNPESLNPKFIPRLECVKDDSSMIL